MPILFDTAYPRLKGELPEREVQELYTPTEDERAFAHGVSSSATTRIAILLQLKLYQHLGYVPGLTDVPFFLVRHIAHVEGYRRPKLREALAAYDASSARRAHQARIRAFLELKVLDADGRTWLSTVARSAAETKRVIPDIVNVMLEALVLHRYELPSLQSLERMAATAREAVHARIFRDIAAALPDGARAWIDDLVRTPPGQTFSSWQLLKAEPKRPTKPQIRNYLQHVRRLHELAEKLPTVNIPAVKVAQFIEIAQATDASELAEFKPDKRYALATLFIRSQYANTLDDVADTYIKQVQIIEGAAQRKLQEHQLEHATRADFLIKQLRDLLAAYQSDGSDSERLGAMDQSLQAEVAHLIAECEEHMAFADKNYLPFLLAPYTDVRSVLLSCLEIVGLKSSSQDTALERLIALLLGPLRSIHRELIDLGPLGIDAKRDLGWLSANWRREVFSKAAQAKGPTWVHRKYFELAVVVAVKQDLKSGDLFIPHGDRFDDYREHLADDATLDRELAAYAQASGVPVDAEAFVKGVRKQLTTRARLVNARMPKNEHVRLVDGRLHIDRLTRAPVPAGVQELDSLLAQRLPESSILDVILDGARALDLQRFFRPLAGTEPRIPAEDMMRRVVSTIFCFGCNLGPVQASRSIKELSRRQVTWLNIKYVTENTLQRAIDQVINAYNKFELPSYWGDGKSVSADGTKWSMYDNNAFSEYHLRYGSPGGIGYYHTTNHWIAWYSHFQTCGVHEGVYILDPFIANQSDVQPDTVHGDTQAQSLPIFGLAHLLGIKLMPRIRSIHDLTFFRPEAGKRYKHLEPLFGESIDWDLIARHFRDMLRVAVSIRLGKILPSTVLRRLGTYSRKNKLYFAFRELGRAVRTEFLLEYIDSIEVRRMVQKGANRSESMNDFLQWALFGNKGVIEENLRHEQRKIIKYNHLVANLVILHNVVAMSQALRDLIREGKVIEPETLAGLSPLRTSHINRLGIYSMDLSRISPSITNTHGILRNQ